VPRPIAGWLVLVVVAAYLAGSACVLEGRQADLEGLAWLLAIVPIAIGWRASRGLPLRGMVGWALVAWCLIGVAIAIGSNRPIAGPRSGEWAWIYAATASALASLLTPLNARRPGAAAWALLMALLVLFLSLPRLEGLGLVGGGPPRPPRLEAPWSWFFTLASLVATANYLPTRYGPAAGVAGVGLAAALAAIAGPSLEPDTIGRLWSFVAWQLLATPWVALACALVPDRTAGEADRLWRFFRDHWGFVWAERVRARFNESAIASKLPMRMGWRGLLAIDGPLGDDDLATAEALLRGLLRRFLPGPPARP